MPFRVLFCTNSFQKVENGPGLFANILKKSLIDDVQHNDELDFRILTEDIDTSKEQPKVYGIQLKRTEWNKLIYQLIRIYKYYKTSKSIRKQWEFDAVLYNNAFTGLCSAYFCKSRVLVMINDDNRLAHKSRSFSLSLSYLKSAMLYYLEKTTARKADKVIVNSKYLKKIIEKHYELDVDKTMLLYKGVELHPQPPLKSSSIVNPVNILFVKNDFHRGGLHTLARSLDLLSGSYNFHLTVVGTSQRDLETVTNMLEPYSFTFNLTGIIEPKAIANLLSQTDIFCVPSLKEALGVANLEAMANAVSVVSTRTGGIPEVLDDGKAGWLVETNNPQELAMAVQECIENDELRLQKINYGLQHVQKFSSENLINNLKKLLIQKQEA
ncbi:glycosyltransferase family 4 protein [Nonlabens ponticola]|nr:glycosyltransferase family 4 protein [Nonlabens ponticola]